MTPLALATISGEDRVVRIGDLRLDVDGALLLRDRLDQAIRAATGDTQADRELDDWLDHHFRHGRQVRWWVVGHRERNGGVLVPAGGSAVVVRLGERVIARCRPHPDGRRLVGFAQRLTPGPFGPVSSPTGARVAVGRQLAVGGA